MDGPSPVRRALLALVVAAAGACGESVNHENIGRWLNTQRGPEKLLAAFSSGEHDADLRAHAAQNLIALDQFDEVRKVLEPMPESQRHGIAAKLAPRLWEDAKIDGEMTVPNERQWAAKDALFELRRFASEATRAEIDRYLVEWFAGGYYEGRATVGRITGKLAIRAIGEEAGPKLLESARSIVARPPDSEGNRPKVGPELLTGLALTGDPDAVGFLLQLVTSERKDETLPARALGALIFAYVDPIGLEPADPAALEPHIDALVAITRDANVDGVMKNDAVALIAAVGMPKCLPPFVDMITYPHKEEQFVWIGTQKGIRCAGVEGIAPLLEAMPTDRRYERAMLQKYVWDEILALSARGSVAEQARNLLTSKSWVARVSGAELLGQLSIAATAEDDVKKIRELAGDKAVLKGWWGKQNEGTPAEKKPDPRLADIAAELAKRLEEVAKRAGSK
jgi:hypothetical protein